MAGDPESQRRPPAQPMGAARARAHNVVSVPLSDAMRQAHTRLQEIIEWIASGKSPRDAAYKSMEVHGLPRTTANRYVATAILMLQRDSSMEPVESKRARLVTMLQRNIERALKMRRGYVSEGEYIEVDAPDIRGANQAIALLAEIEGVKVTG